MEHAVERSLDLDEVGDVVQHELKIALVPQVSDVGRGAGDEVVHPHDAMTLPEQPVAQVRAEKTRGPRYEDAHASGRPMLSLVNASRARRAGSWRFWP